MSPTVPDTPDYQSGAISPVSAGIPMLPGVGIDLTYNFTATARLVAFVGAFTTSNTVATRQVMLEIADNAGNMIYQMAFPIQQVASTTVVYTAAIGISALAVTGPPSMRASLPLPAEVVAAAGWQFLTVTANNQLTDAWSGSFLTLGVV